MRRSPKAKDEADEAAEQQEYLNNEALYQARKRGKVERTGKCGNCDAPCEGAFCDRGCREDYERRSNIERKQRGT
jgi:hypothetical protein